MLSDMKASCPSLIDDIPFLFLSGAKTLGCFAINGISCSMKYSTFSFGGVWVREPVRHKSTGHHYVVVYFHFELNL